MSPETLASVSTRVLDCELSVCDLGDKIRFEIRFILRGSVVDLQSSCVVKKRLP